ncbi:hypothetical protein [Stappia sp.]|uniref:hypothetical protein n=1 Tax=Stappia sp. TaxID=1870903 RepID=UPI003D0D144F
MKQASLMERERNLFVRFKRGDLEYNVSDVGWLEDEIQSIIRDMHSDLFEDIGKYKLDTEKIESHLQRKKESCK